MDALLLTLSVNAIIYLIQTHYKNKKAEKEAALKAEVVKPEEKNPHAHTHPHPHLH